MYIITYIPWTIHGIHAIHKTKNLCIHIYIYTDTIYIYWIHWNQFSIQHTL